MTSTELRPAFDTVRQYYTPVGGEGLKYDFSPYSLGEANRRRAFATAGYRRREAAFSRGDEAELRGEVIAKGVSWTSQLRVVDAGFALASSERENSSICFSAASFAMPYRS